MSNGPWLDKIGTNYLWGKVKALFTGHKHSGSDITSAVANANYAAFAGNFAIGTAMTGTNDKTYLIGVSTTSGGFASGRYSNDVYYAAVTNTFVAPNFSGSGAKLTGVNGSNVTGTVANATKATYATGLGTTAATYKVATSLNATATSSLPTSKAVADYVAGQIASVELTAITNAEIDEICV